MPPDLRRSSLSELGAFGGDNTRGRKGDATVIDFDIVFEALEMIFEAFGHFPDKPVPTPSSGSTDGPLSPQERELAKALLARRPDVSKETAESLVRWLRTQPLRFER